MRTRRSPASLTQGIAGTAVLSVLVAVAFAGTSQPANLLFAQLTTSNNAFCRSIIFSLQDQKGVWQNYTLTNGQALPVPLQPNQAFTAYLGFQNNGTSKWNGSRSYQIGSQDPQDTMRWGVSRIPLVKGDVKPTQAIAYPVNGKAPSAAGSYAFSWQMLQGTKWFGDICRTPITVQTPPPPPPPAPQMTTVSVTKRANQASVAPGSTLSYTLGIANTGMAIARNARIDDYSEIAVSQGAVFVPEQSPGCSVVGNITRCGGYDLKPGESRNFKLVFRVRSTTPCTTVFRNAAGVAADNASPAYVQNITTPVACPPPPPPKAPKDLAAFVSVDGPTTLHVGDSAVYHATWRNAGEVTWNATGDYALVADPQFANHALLPGFRISLPSAVAPGQTVTFDIPVSNVVQGGFALAGTMVRGTERLGTNNFALLVSVLPKTPVNTADDAGLVGIRGPDTLAPGESATYEIEYHNFGRSTWSAGEQFGLGMNPAYATSNIFRAVILVDRNVPPGESYVFRAPFTAKEIGYFTAEGLMMHNGVAFGQTKPNGKSIRVRDPLPLPANAAECTGTMIPKNVQRGEPFDATVTYRNVGTNTWTRGSYQLIPSVLYFSGRDFGIQATDLPTEQVAPGESVTFTLHALASKIAAKKRPFVVTMAKGNEAFAATCGQTVDIMQ